ncbi:MAG: hypothetical protein OXK72_09475 [Gammaproteobacteria bacterium]|nr:hypothetical protein [Gammaproteobacteria bacterium]MDE0412182.1 hypothetical protein [Gammaproteobacteria bacterium]
MFFNWLRAECFCAEWRLGSYLKVLSSLSEAEATATYIETDVLHSMRKSYTSLVLKCFVELTNLLPANGSAVYIRPEIAKQILQVGLEDSDNSVKAYAEKARENLLQRGYSSILDKDDG